MKTSGWVPVMNHSKLHKNLSEGNVLGWSAETVQISRV